MRGHESDFAHARVQPVFPHPEPLTDRTVLHCRIPHLSQVGTGRTVRFCSDQKHRAFRAIRAVIMLDRESSSHYYYYDYYYYDYYCAATEATWQQNTDRTGATSVLGCCTLISQIRLLQRKRVCLRV